MNPEKVQTFWTLLDDTLSVIKIPIILLGNFNAQMGKERKFRNANILFTIGQIAMGKDSLTLVNNRNICCGHFCKQEKLSQSDVGFATIEAHLSIFNGCRRNKIFEETELRS